MRVRKTLFLLAAAIALFGALAHELAGAPQVLEPLAGSGLTNEVVWLHHFSWHVGTVAVLAMATLFLIATRHPDGALFAWVATGMSAGFAVLGIGLAIFGNAALWQTPAPYPWGLIAVLGFVGARIKAAP
ncbi:MAG: hypothetical protein AAGM16_07735 [Pseudomonadota bacterium]